MVTMSDLTGLDLSPRRLKNGLAVFALLTVCAMTGVLFFTGSAESWQALRSFRPDYLLLCIVLGALNHFWSCCQLHVLIRKLNPAYKFWHSCEAMFGNIFLAAITPTQSGGGPAQFVILKMHGLTYPQALAAGFMQFFASLVFLLLSAIFLLLFQSQLITNETVGYLLNYGVAVLLGIGAVFMLAIFRPKAVEWVVRRILYAIAALLPAKRRAIIRLTVHLCTGIEESHYAILYFFRKGKSAIFGSIIFVTASMLTKFVIAYVILLGFGFADAPFIKVMTIQVLLNFMIYFAPSPGASGVAEVAAALLMSMIIPKHFLGIFAVLWRLFTVFLGVGLGTWVMICFVARFDENLAKLKTSTRKSI